MHATIGIPNGRGLLSPIIATIAAQPKTKHYKQRTICLNQATKQALNDWRMLLPTALHHPTPCTDLITALADYGGYCDASKAGAGGIWVGLNRALPPLVWRVAFPPEIQAEVVSHANPRGRISNSDLEMMGLLLQWVVLEQVSNLQHAHVACWCDNTPTVAWATRLLSTKATNAARILRILALRMLACEASPITTQHIAGELNTMADFASRSFTSHPDPRQFLTTFHSRFPLLQNASWTLCCLPNALIGCILSTLSTKTSKLGSWRRLSKHGSIIGRTGPTSFQQISTRSFNTQISKHDSYSYKFSLSESGKVTLAEDTKSKPAAYKPHWEPLPRPSNWLASTTPSTGPEPPTTTLP